MIQLLPIKQTVEANAAFVNNPDCADTLQITIDYFNRIGYTPPWVGYYASMNGMIVGSARHIKASREQQRLRSPMARCRSIGKEAWNGYLQGTG